MWSTPAAALQRLVGPGMDGACHESKGGTKQNLKRDTKQNDCENAG